MNIRVWTVLCAWLLSVASAAEFVNGWPLTGSGNEYAGLDSRAVQDRMVIRLLMVSSSLEVGKGPDNSGMPDHPHYEIFPLHGYKPGTLRIPDSCFHAASFAQQYGPRNTPAALSDILNHMAEGRTK